jgi:hypothetical protein
MESLITLNSRRWNPDSFIKDTSDIVVAHIVFEWEDKPPIINAAAITKVTKWDKK